MSQTRYITTAIPYVNASPHIGHALEYLQADMLSRYYRQHGDRVRWQWGTDDNSLKNVRAAQMAGEDTEAFVSRHAEVFRGLKDVLGLTFDGFMRTRHEQHIRGAQKLWSALKPEDIYKKAYTGLYCVGCEAFYTDDEAQEGACPIHKKALEKIQEENYFFKLSNYQKEIEKLIDSDRLNICPDVRKNEALGFIRQGLQDFSISRSVERAEHWGVPVPGDASQVMYVWVDALSQYITALGFADESAEYKTFWEQGEVRLHVLGKDIMRFHAVYWPAFLMSAGLPLPTNLFIHGFFTVNGEKMSKSLGNVLEPVALVQEFGLDAIRFAFLRSLSLTSDGDISTEVLEKRHAELANGIGNLVSRVAAMANKNFSSGLDRAVFDGAAHDAELASAIAEYDFKKYVDVVWSVVDAANEKIEKESPFRLVKTDEAAAKKSLSELAAMIRWIAEALKPVIPATADEIARRYALDVIEVGPALFPRRDV